MLAFGMTKVSPFSRSSDGLTESNQNSRPCGQSCRALCVVDHRVSGVPAAPVMGPERRKAARVRPGTARTSSASRGHPQRATFSAVPEAHCDALGAVVPNADVGRREHHAPGTGAVLDHRRPGLAAAWISAVLIGSPIRWPEGAAVPNRYESDVSSVRLTGAGRRRGRCHAADVESCANPGRSRPRCLATVAPGRLRMEMM